MRLEAVFFGGGRGDDCFQSKARGRGSLRFPSAPSPPCCILAWHGRNTSDFLSLGRLSASCVKKDKTLVRVEERSRRRVARWVMARLLGLVVAGPFFFFITTKQTGYIQYIELTLATPLQVFTMRPAGARFLFLFAQTGSLTSSSSGSHDYLD